MLKLTTTCETRRSSAFLLRPLIGYVLGQMFTGLTTTIKKGQAPPSYTIHIMFEVSLFRYGRTVVL